MALGARLGLHRGARGGRRRHRARHAAGTCGRGRRASRRLLLLHGRSRARDRGVDLRDAGAPRPGARGGPRRRGDRGRARRAGRRPRRVPDAVLHGPERRLPLRAQGLRLARPALHATRARGPRVRAAAAPARRRAALAETRGPRGGGRDHLPEPPAQRRRGAQHDLRHPGDVPRLRRDARGPLRLRPVRRRGVALRVRPARPARRADREPAVAHERPRVPGLGHTRRAGERARLGARLAGAARPSAPRGSRARHSRSPPRTSGRTGSTSGSASRVQRAFAAHAWARPPAGIELQQ